MKLFVDSSVVLRRLLNEPHPLTPWPQAEHAYASQLIRAEVGRVIDRIRLRGQIDDTQVAWLHDEGRRSLATLEIIDLTESIWQRAAEPLPTSLGTLDALHLASALELKRLREPSLVLATHDPQLALAARASGLPVIGVPRETTP